MRYRSPVSIAEPDRPVTATSRYLLVRNGQAYGPFTIPELARFETERRVAADDQIRLEGEDTSRPWREVRAELGLAPVSPPVASPPTTRPTFDAETEPVPERNVALEVFVPVNVSPLALIAPYVGVASLFTCGILGPVAIILGIVAARTRKRGQAGMARAVVAIVLGSLACVLGVAFLVTRLLA